jgi:hypothetical protein
MVGLVVSESGRTEANIQRYRTGEQGYGSPEQQRFTLGFE